ncbi:DUF4362 domain-containing protein [Bacillus mangrovi]|uniref:DUF4362 domain-containing protein n=1 Tax=Metabacillus mangrovi TaxID=1491830 RepID=A0A7X2S8V4_9BACI|nr:DUF4362 domain-containing protein [Metabacillus mangrovi]MTH55346.1 DUF4362 domain-containing protein [Metabacillus mangrovi]
MKNTWTLLIGIILSSLLLSGCGEYNPSDEDVVDSHGEVTNYNKFIQFINNLNTGKDNKEKIRVVRYTNEGDPILHDLEYDGKKIISTIDRTRDEFGTQQVDTTSCKTIDSKEDEDKIEYVLSGCEKTNRINSILIVHK